LPPRWSTPPSRSAALSGTALLKHRRRERHRRYVTAHRGQAGAEAAGMLDGFTTAFWCCFGIVLAAAVIVAASVNARAPGDPGRGSRSRKKAPQH